MDALFVFPKTGLDVGGTIAPPFGTMFAASILNKEGKEVKLIDQRVDGNWKSHLIKPLQAVIQQSSLDAGQVGTGGTITATQRQGLTSVQVLQLAIIT